MKKGSDCVFDPVSLLNVPDDPAFCCKKGRTVQAGVNGKWFVKRICHRNLLKAVLHLFTTPRPFNCLRAACRLADAGFDTPKVAAALRKYRFFLPDFDCLITEDISSRAVFCDKMVLTVKLAGELVEFLAKIHNAGIEHGDVNLRNIYRTDDDRLGVIDLDGCRLYRSSVSKKQRQRELARLASSFIKLAAEQKCANDLPDNIPEYFSELYLRNSGMDLYSDNYRKRVKYLTERKRK